MVVKLLQEGEKSLYRDFVQKSADAKIYHTLEWGSIIEETYGYKPFYIIAKENNEIKGILPLFEVESFILGKRMVSIPFSHFVNILYHGEPTLYQLLQFAEEITKRNNCKYIEIKNGYELPDNANLRKGESNYISILNLDRPIDDLWRSFDGSVRRAIRKAERSRLRIVGGETLEDYGKFYVLEVETRKRQGSPVYPFSFFVNLFNYLGKIKKILLYLAYYEDKPVAGILLLCHRNYMIYGYGASVSDPEYLRLRPNNLLFWRAIKASKTSGYRIFDFGITPPSNPGLLRFKMQWGTETRKLPYYYGLIHTKEMPIIDRTGWKVQVSSSILKKLPTPFFRTVSPILLRQLG